MLIIIIIIIIIGQKLIIPVSREIGCLYRLHGKVTDPDLLVVQCNQRSCRVLGPQTADDVITMSIIALHCKYVMR